MANHAGLMSLPLESQRPRASSLASMGKSLAFLHQPIDSGAASPSLSIPSYRMGWCAPCLAGRDRSECSSCSQMPDQEGGWAPSGAGPPPPLALKGPQIPSHRRRSTLDPLLVGPHPGLVNALKAAASGRVDLCPSVEDSPPLISFCRSRAPLPAPACRPRGFLGQQRHHTRYLCPILVRLQEWEGRTLVTGAPIKHCETWASSWIWEVPMQASPPHFGG